MTETTCPRCKQQNQCAISLNQPPESCWCMEGITKDSSSVKLPMPEKTDTACYCKRCLEEVKASVQEHPVRPVHPDHT